MTGTKWYKLNKSNELLQITLHEELHDLEATLSDELTSALTTIAEIVFSGLLTYFIDEKVDLLSFLWPYLSIIPNQSAVLWGTIILCSSVFLGSLAICKLVMYAFKKIKDTFKDAKKTQTGIYQLERYFYQKVLNDIITGISLEKKSYELNAETDKSVSPVQDQNLASIYLIESVFYFHEALTTIAEKHIFETANKKRTEYTDFLETVNPFMVCDVFFKCEQTLTRIKDILEKTDSKTTEKAKAAYEGFRSYRCGICTQMGIKFSNSSPYESSE